jgi:hypothetical protein
LVYGGKKIENNAGELRFIVLSLKEEQPKKVTKPYGYHR